MDLQESELLFINEAEELLEVMESCLLEVESEEAAIEEHIDAIFRAAHTIKGSAGLFGFDSIVAFTHSVESVLDKVRAASLGFDNELTDLMLECQQHMAQMIKALSDPKVLTDNEKGTRLLEQLDHYIHPDKSSAAAPEPVVEEAPTDPKFWRIQIDYGEDVFRDGMDPCSQLRFLENLGRLHQVRVAARFPETEFDPESCYLTLQLALESDATKTEIEGVFEFIQESSEVSIGSPKAMLDNILAYPEESDRIGEVLVNTGVVTERELQQALHTQKQSLQENKPTDTLGSMLVQKGVVDESMVDAALTKQKGQDHRKPADFQFLKVDARKLDQLIGLIGELVTSGATNELLISQVQNEKLDESFSQMVHLVEQIRDGALGLRMVQIGESFGRLKRIVRDVAKELDKDIQLDILGAETELDKSMVEKLSDPLMHIVRNAIDHGIEPQDIRLYKGKPAKGYLKLNAYHEAGAVVIEIVDDGAGLNAEKVRAKAVEKGLITAEQSLGKEDIYKLIFEPGFSTASAVTNLSGRGVGMDVVKRNIDELRGQISIESELDVGTTFRIRLPLTLAIIDGFEVSVGESHLVIPVNLIQECISFDASQMTKDRNYLNVRDEVLPFVKIREVLAIGGTRAEREHVVIVQFGNNRAGLVVDHLRGELQAVIKPLNEMFRSIRGIGGSTILGSGDIGFILDVPKLIELATHQESRRTHLTSVTSSKGEL